MSRFFMPAWKVRPYCEPIAASSPADKLMSSFKLLAIFFYRFEFYTKVEDVVEGQQIHYRVCTILQLMEFAEVAVLDNGTMQEELYIREQRR